MKSSQAIIITLPLLAIASSAFATNSTFIFDESTDLFGEFAGGATGGVQGNDFNGPFEEFSTVGNLNLFNNGVHLPETAANFDEAPVDATSLLLSHGNNNAVSHLIDNTNTYDLSTQGDSLRFVFANHYIQTFNPEGGSFNNNFTLFEIGITTTGMSTFGAAGDDSFFFAGVSTTMDLEREVNALTPNNTFDVVTFDENSVDANGPGVLGTGNVLAAGLNLDAVAQSGPSDASSPTNPGGISYLYDFTITNASSTTFDINYTITEFLVTGLQEDDTVTATGNVFSGTQLGVVHGLNEAELDEVALGLGYRTLDSNNPNSGTTFDINAQFLLAVPEPSSSALLGLAGFAFILRRKRS